VPVTPAMRSVMKAVIAPTICAAACSMSSSRLAK
jgi:hypothetical protein